MYNPSNINIHSACLFKYVCLSATIWVKNKHETANESDGRKTRWKKKRGKCLDFLSNRTEWEFINQRGMHYQYHMWQRSASQIHINTDCTVLVCTHTYCCHLMNSFMKQSYSTNVKVRYEVALTALNHCTTGSGSNSSQAWSGKIHVRSLNTLYFSLIH